MHAVQAFLSLPEKLPQNIMAENNTHFITAHDWTKFSWGIFCCGGALTPWVVFRQMTRSGGLSLAALCPTPQWGWWKSWFSSNWSLEHLHVASPAWQFTLTNLKETRDLKWWLQGSERGVCSSEWCSKLAYVPTLKSPSVIFVDWVTSPHNFKSRNTKPYPLMRKGSKNLQPCVKAGIHAYVYWRCAVIKPHLCYAVVNPMYATKCGVQRVLGTSLVVQLPRNANAGA